MTEVPVFRSSRPCQIVTGVRRSGLTREDIYGSITRRPNAKPVQIALWAAVVVGLLCAVLS